METEKVIYIHPGFPKTATSFIQTKFFTQHPMINNLGKKKSISDIDKDLLNVFNRIILNIKITEEEHKENLKVINSIDFKPDRINLISYEAFTQTNLDIKIEEIFDRLNILFLECNYKLKILVTIRNQLTIIPSHFANSPKIYEKRLPPKWKYFKNFIKSFENINKIKDTKYIVVFDRYKYFELLKTLIKVFSKENVKFCFYENLTVNRKFFFDDIASFLGIENNIILNNTDEYVNETRKYKNNIKRINKYVFKNLPISLKFIKVLIPNFLKKIIRSYLANFIIDIKYLNDPIKIDSKMKKTILNYYKKDNELLGEFLKIDLKSLEYLND